MKTTRFCLRLVGQEERIKLPNVGSFDLGRFFSQRLGFVECLVLHEGPDTHR